MLSTVATAVEHEAAYVSNCETEHASWYYDQMQL